MKNDDQSAGDEGIALLGFLVLFFGFLALMGWVLRDVM